MPKNVITSFVRLAVRSAGKPSNTADITFAAARNVGVSIVRALNTSAISELDTFSEISKPSASAKLLSTLEKGAKTSSQALHTLNSVGLVNAKECKAAILLNIENAKRSNDQEYVTDQIAKVFELLAAMKEDGFLIEEEIYGPVLNFLTDMKMVEEFHMIVEAIRDYANSSPRLGFYEMFLWIKLKDEEKIKEACSMIINSFKELRESTETITENYLLALVEKDQHMEILMILETLDITRVYSFDNLTSIFEYLGRWLLESIAKKLLRGLNENGRFYFRSEVVSKLINSYVTSIPNLWVGGALLKFNELHEELEVSPSSESYEMLIKCSCDSREEEIGLSILKHMYEVGLVVSPDAAIYLFRTIEQNYGFDLLRGVQDVLKEMHRNGDECRMFNLRLAVYISDVLFGRCEGKQKKVESYEPWLMNNYFRCKLDDYKKDAPYSRSYDERD